MLCIHYTYLKIPFQIRVNQTHLVWSTEASSESTYSRLIAWSCICHCVSGIDTCHCDFGQCVYAYWWQITKLNHISFRFVEVLSPSVERLQCAVCIVHLCHFLLLILLVLLASIFHWSWLNSLGIFSICGSILRWCNHFKVWSRYI